jgi:hypothetical protein
VEAAAPGICPGASPATPPDVTSESAQATVTTQTAPVTIPLQASLYLRVVADPASSLTLSEAACSRARSSKYLEGLLPGAQSAAESWTVLYSGFCTKKQLNLESWKGCIFFAAKQQNCDVMWFGSVLVVWICLGRSCRNPIAHTWSESHHKTWWTPCTVGQPELHLGGI